MLTKGGLLLYNILINERNNGKIVNDVSDLDGGESNGAIRNIICAEQGIRRWIDA